MFENYRATKKDFEAIEEGIKAVWHPKMRFVFRDLTKIANTVVISYDSKFIYLWNSSSLSNYPKYQFPHKLRLKNEWQYAWCAGIWDKEIEKLLPKKIQQASHFKIPRISGGLLKPFVTLQKKIKDTSLNPYTSYESYLATIVHEFGHVYWNQHKLWWYSNKKQNLAYLRLAKNLHKKEGEASKVSLNLPINAGIGEVFAFCTEYYASQLFWPNHKKNLDTFSKERIKELIKLEHTKDLEKEDSVIEPNKNPHDFASVLGKIIISQHPQTWPRILTNIPPITTRPC